MFLINKYEKKRAATKAANIAQRLEESNATISEDELPLSSLMSSSETSQPNDQRRSKRLATTASTTAAATASLTSPAAGPSQVFSLPTGRSSITITRAALPEPPTSSTFGQQKVSEPPVPAKRMRVAKRTQSLAATASARAQTSAATTPSQPPAKRRFVASTAPAQTSTPVTTTRVLRSATARRSQAVDEAVIPDDIAPVLRPVALDRKHVVPIIKIFCDYLVFRRVQTAAQVFELFSESNFKIETCTYSFLYSRLRSFLRNLTLTH